MDNRLHKALRRYGAAGVGPILNPDLRIRGRYLPLRTNEAEYLQVVKNNVLAEYACFVKEAKVEQTFEIYDDTFLVVEDTNLHLLKLQVSEEKTLPLEELDYHLLVIGGYLALAVLEQPERRHLIIEIGVQTSKLTMQNKEHFDSECILDLGYVGDVINKLDACNDMLRQSPKHPLLQAIADPTLRAQALYCDRPISPAVPINEGQQKALQNLKYNIEGIQGPPGTGKSTLIFHIMNSALSSDDVTLATCVQNKAVDAITEKLAKSKQIPFFVHGNEKRLGLVSKEWTIEAQVNRHPELRDLTQKIRRCEAVRTAINRFFKPPFNTSFRNTRRAERAEELFGSDNEVNENKKRQWLSRDMWSIFWKKHMCKRHPWLAAARDKVTTEASRLCNILDGRKLQVHNDILYGAKAILCTVDTASRSLLSARELQDMRSLIKTAIMDEAGTTPESCMPLLLRLPHLERIIAVGDQQQLSPFTRLPMPKMCKFGLQCYSRSTCRFEHDPAATTPSGFFQRLTVALRKGAVPMMSLQYRMHPKISDYVSSCFYNNKLQAADQICDSRLEQDPDGMWWLSSDSKEETPEKSTSKRNPGEADLVLRVLQDMNRSDLMNRRSVMVITFYKSQEHLLRKRLREVGMLESCDTNRGLRILTVDQSQGSEADIVVLSCVRSNSRGDIGFVKNPNRLNVAVSRTRFRLIVVGDEKTIGARDANWAQLYRACRKVSSVGDIAPFSLNESHDQQQDEDDSDSLSSYFKNMQLTSVERRKQFPVREQRNRPCSSALLYIDMFRNRNKI
eukprot:m.165419 g.165419  ORF g.165419 m.165419 type:complete len:791 (-) comp16424_c0_seq1:136-2508(-)